MNRTSAFAVFFLLASHAALGESPRAPAPTSAPTPASVPTRHLSRAYSTAAIDRYLESEMRRQKIPGMSLAVVKNGEPLYVKSYGVATLEHPVPTAPQTVYQIGSV